MDEQPAATGAAPERHGEVVGHLPLRAGWLQQVPPLCLRRLPLPMEA